MSVNQMLLPSFCKRTVRCTDRLYQCALPTETLRRAGGGNGVRVGIGVGIGVEMV